MRLHSDQDDLLDLAPKQRAAIVFSHLRQQVRPRLGSECSGEQKLWLAVLERALFDLEIPPRVPASSPLTFLTTSGIIEHLGLEPAWVFRLLLRYGLIQRNA